MDFFWMNLESFLVGYVSGRPRPQ